jgi:hypothetical protein
MAFLAWCIINDAEGTFACSIMQHFRTETKAVLNRRAKMFKDY